MGLHIKIKMRFNSEIISKFSVKAKIEEVFNEFFDLDLKCLKCFKVVLWYLPEVKENEICEKLWEAFS